MFLFLSILLVPLFGSPYVYFGYSFGNVSSAISRAESRGKKIAIGFFGYFL